MLIALFVFSITGTFFNLTPTASGNSGYKWLTIKYSPDPMAWNGYEVVPDILPSPGTYNYTLNSVINVTAPLIVNVTNDVRYVFDHWEVYLEESNITKTATVNSITVKMDENKTATAYYRIQYLFTVVTAFDKPYIWYGGAWHQESSHWFEEYAITYASVTKEHVDLNFSMRAKFVEWTGDWTGKEIRPNGRVRAGPINMTGPKTVVANWVIEYFLTKDSVYGPWSPGVPYAIGKYYTSVEKAIDRIVALQSSSDYGWDWDVTGLTSHSADPSAGNIYGVTALGLLDAFELTQNITYFFAAQKVADYLTSGPMPLHGHGFGPDYMFLVRFSEVSGRPEYKDYAIKAWNWQKANWGRYADGNQTYLYNYFYNNWVSSHGIVIWNTAFYALAAYYLGDTEWAENMTKVIAANFTKITNDGYQYIGWGNALRLFQTIDPVGYATEIESAVNSLKSSQTYSGCWPGGWTQDAAYAIMGLAAVGEMEAAEKGADWLVSTQGYNSIVGGWKQPDGKEYSEVTSEAAQALAAVAKCWYEEGTDVELTAPEYVNVNPNHWRYRFDYWTVETWNGTAWVNPQNFTTPTITIHMNSPMKATVHFWLQYYVTVKDAPSAVDSGVELLSGYYDYCSDAVFTAPEIVPYTNNTRFIFKEWFNPGIVDWYNTTYTLHIDKEYTITAIYNYQYYIDVETDPADVGLISMPTGEGWYTVGDTCNCTAELYVYVDSGTRYKFVKWTFDGWTPGVGKNIHVFTVDKPYVAVAHYVKQYHWKTYDEPIDGVYDMWEGWADENSTLRFVPPSYKWDWPYSWVLDYLDINGVKYPEGWARIRITEPLAVTAYYKGAKTFFLSELNNIYTAPSTGKNFTISVVAANFEDLYAADFQITWNSTLLEVTNVEVNVSLWQNPYWWDELTTGSYRFVGTETGNVPGFNGSWTIAKLTFHIIYDPCYIKENYYVDSLLNLTVNKLANSQGQQIWCSQRDAYYRIYAVKPKFSITSNGQDTVTKWSKGDTFTATIFVENAVKLHSWYAKITYNKTLLEVTGVQLIDTFLNRPYVVEYVNWATPGLITINVETDCSTATGAGALATIEFKVKHTIFWTKANPKLTDMISFSYLRIDVLCPNKIYIDDPKLTDTESLQYVYDPIPGDLNMDGEVNVLDLQLVAADYGSTTTYDLNEDGKVDLIDLVLVAINYGRTKP